VANEVELGFRPFSFVPIMEFLSGPFAIEGPIDFGAVTVHLVIPGLCFFAQGLQVADPTRTQALAGKQADLDFGLIKPTAMFGCVVNGKAIPKAASNLLSELVYHRLMGMGTEVVHDQMNSGSLRILGGNIQKVAGKLRRGAVCRCLGKVHPGFGFDPAKHVGAATAFIFIISSGYASGLHRECWPHILV